MLSRTLSWLFVLSLTAAIAGCAMLDAEGQGTADDSSSRSVMRQPVFIEPLFVLEGLDDLPSSFQLDELHLGVGAIFLDLIDAQDGVAFANRDPFQLHFVIRDGRLSIRGPAMTLPQGGRYQVSVQLEPQPRLAETPAVDGVRSLETPGEEASLVLSGRVTQSQFPNLDDDDDDDTEPAPLPWRPTEVFDIGRLQRNVDVFPFSYSSDRTVRFVLEDVELEGGSSNELVMMLPVGEWVRETIRPAVDRAIDSMPAGEVTDEEIENLELELRERLAETGDGIDRLIGGMDVEVRAGQ